MTKMEDAFFQKKDRELIEQYQAMEKMVESKENLKAVSGIQDEHILQKLVELQIRPETLASLAMIPCVLAAWADGNVEPREKEAILAAVSKLGWGKNSIDYSLLERWMEHKPAPELFEAWDHYVNGLCRKLTAAEVLNVKQEIIAHAKAVAESSGGILGIGKISKPEKEMLLKLENAFLTCR